MDRVGGSVQGWVGFAASALLAAACISAVGQQQSIPRQPIPQSPGQVPSASEDPENDAMARHALEMQANKRNALRQQQIVADSNKIVALAEQLKAEVARGDQKNSTLSLISKTEEIEKLARSVKEKMKAQ